MFKKNLNKYFLVLILICIFFFSLYNTTDLKLDASSDSLIQKNDETFKIYEFYNKLFPSKNFLILTIKSKKKIDKKYIDDLRDLQNNINKLDNVESSFSILDAPILLSNNLSISDLANGKIYNLRNTKESLDVILDEFSSSPILKDQIINSSKDLSSIIIYPKKNRNFDRAKEKRKLISAKNQYNKKIEKKYLLEKEINANKKNKLIKEIRVLLKKKNNKYQYFLGGIDMISSDTINFVKNDILIFSFAVILFIILLLYIIFRDLKWVFIPLISTLYAVILMIGFIGLIDWQITAISSNFISLMMILSISMNIHIINFYRINENNNNYYLRLKNTIVKMFWPCFYTALTTIVAFSSLLFSDIKPIIDFGYIMIIALIFILATSFSVLPVLIYFFPKINKQRKYEFNILNIFYKHSIKSSKLIIATNIFIFAISIIGIYKLNVENSFINYFKSDTEIYKGMKIIDTELGGTTPLDIIVKFNDEKFTNLDKNNNQSNLEDNIIDDELEGELDISSDLFFEEDKKDPWFTAEKILTITKIHQYLESKNEIGKVQSIYSLITMGNLINKKPLSIFELNILNSEIPNEYRERLIKPFLSIDENTIKITARIRDSYEINRNNLILDINNFIEKEFENIEKYEVNGLLVLYNNMLQSLFKSQIKSFGIILIAIFIMFVLLFKSVKLSIIAMVPNIIASTSILGIIGIFNIPLDIMTITIAAITIGIAVDNTIHYIYRINENNKNKKLIESSIKNAHVDVGKAVLTTSLTISFGFSVLILSNFIPTILFGIFTSLAMLIAMLGVLITLPTLINKIKL